MGVVLAALACCLFSEVASQPTTVHWTAEPSEYGNFHTKISSQKQKQKHHLDHFSRISELHAPRHAPWTMLCFVPMLIGC